MRDDLQEIVCPVHSLYKKPIKVALSHLQSKLSYCPSCKSLLKIICKYCWMWTFFLQSTLSHWKIFGKLVRIFTKSQGEPGELGRAVKVTRGAGEACVQARITTAAVHLCRSPAVRPGQRARRESRGGKRDSSPFLKIISWGIGKNRIEELIRVSIILTVLEPIFT